MALFSKIFAKLRIGGVSDSDWDELRSSLIESDLGAKLSDDAFLILTLYNVALIS